jgi:[acyl-carrier-protein] S-malonyltransferase
VIAFIFPGQGSQSVGMGRALADAYPEAAAAFAEADAAYATAAGDEPDEGIAARSLSEVVFEGPAEELMRTERAQPAILTMSVAASRVLAGFGVEPAIVAGHSLGEYSAHVVAGTLTLPEAVATVRRRGRYMQDAVPAGAGAMAAVLGADQALVQQACDEAAEGEVVSPANINGPGQVVIAGTVSAVARAGHWAPGASFRCRSVRRSTAR